MSAGRWTYVQPEADIRQFEKPGCRRNLPTGRVAASGQSANHVLLAIIVLLAEALLQQEIRLFTHNIARLEHSG